MPGKLFSMQSTAVHVAITARHFIVLNMSSLSPCYLVFRPFKARRAKKAPNGEPPATCSPQPPRRSNDFDDDSDMGGGFRGLSGGILSSML